VRDLGLLIWVVFLVIGVMGSMVSSIRKQMAAGPRAPSQRPPGPQAPQLPPQAPLGQPQGSLPAGVQELLNQAFQTRIEPAPARPPSPAPQPRPTRPPQAARAEPVQRPADAPRVFRGTRLFGTGPELVRAVIAAEVLGKPRGLNSEYPWG
jgi:hypothetical protein